MQTGSYYLRQADQARRLSRATTQSDIGAQLERAAERFEAMAARLNQSVIGHSDPGQLDQEYPG